MRRRRLAAALLFLAGGCARPRVDAPAAATPPPSPAAAPVEAAAIPEAVPLSWPRWSAAAFERARVEQRPVVAMVEDGAAPDCLVRALAARQAPFEPPGPAGALGVTVDLVERPDLAEMLAGAATLLNAEEPACPLVVVLTPAGAPLAAARPDESGDWLAPARRAVDEWRADRSAAEARADGTRQAWQRAQLSERPGTRPAAQILESWQRESTAARVSAGRLWLELETEALGAAAASPAARSLRSGFDRTLAEDAQILLVVLEAYRRKGQAEDRRVALELAERLASSQVGPSGLPRVRLDHPHATTEAAGLATAALATAGRGFLRPDLSRSALAWGAALRARIVGGAVQRLEDPPAPGMLADYAALVLAFTRLHVATGEAAWREAAVQVADLAVGRLYDSAQGGFFENEAAHALPLPRARTAFDSRLPAANATLARALLELAEAGGGQRLRDLARATVASFRGDLERSPAGKEALLALLLELEPVPARAAVVKMGPRVARTGPVSAEVLEVSRDPEGGLAARLRIRADEGWMVVGRKPGARDLTPLALSVLDPAYGAAEWQEPLARWRSVWGDQSRQVPVHEGVFELTLRAPPAPRAGPAAETARLRVRFQACRERTCRPPEAVVVESPLR